ncbi:MAG: hypothetical protein ACO2OR_06580, partial [Desulfurococcaceae archaeon]
MYYTRRLANSLRDGDVVKVAIILRGWLRGEYLGVYSNKCLIAVTPRSLRVRVGDEYLVRI